MEIRLPFSARIKSVWRIWRCCLISRALGTNSDWSIEPFRGFWLLAGRKSEQMKRHSASLMVAICMVKTAEERNYWKTSLACTLEVLLWSQQIARALQRNMLLEDDQRHNISQCSNMNKPIYVILYNAIVLMNRYLFRISLINFSIVLSWEEDSRLINEYHYGFFSIVYGHTTKGNTPVIFRNFKRTF